MSKYASIIKYPLYQDFELPAGSFVRKKPCGNYSCIVEDQEVTGFDQFRQIRELTMRQCTIIAIQAKQTTPSTLRGRRFRDQGFRQIKIKILALHDFSLGAR